MAGLFFVRISIAESAISSLFIFGLLALNMTSNRQLNLNNVKDREELYESTKKLGMEMDKISQLTGMSRKDQMDQMEENRNDVRFQANKRLLEAQGFEVGAAAIEDFASSLVKDKKKESENISSKKNGNLLPLFLFFFEYRYVSKYFSCFLKIELTV